MIKLLGIVCICFLVLIPDALFAQSGGSFIDTTKTKVKQDSAVLEMLRENQLDNIPVITVNDQDLNDASTQGLAVVLASSRDPFLSLAAFHFSPLRFRIRGYDPSLNHTFINGMPMDNLGNGNTPWGLWGGLNDVFRNRDQVLGLNATDFSFGEPGLNINFDVRASRQRRQTMVSYANSNRNYGHRLMFTHHSGLNAKGWALSASASRRWADQAYVPGTNFDAFSFFLSADKYLNSRHLLSFTLLGAPTQNARQGPAVQEMINLSGDNFYNPYWGYQSGKVRNASMAWVSQPIAILSHEFKINDAAVLNTGISFTSGERSTTALEWNRAPDPRPDYYRNLPSFQTDPAQAALVEQAIRNDVNLRQINWDRLFEVNRLNFATTNNVNGISGNTYSGLRARYFQGEHVQYTNRFALNTVLNTRISEEGILSVGFNYQSQRTNYFKRLIDLLGANYLVDWNQFAERDFPNDPNAIQNDLRRPNRVVLLRERYGYDYDMFVRRIGLWAQGRWTMENFDAFFAVNVHNNQFWRTGNVRNGLFPFSSFGRSTLNNFLTYGAKAGLTIKADGANFVYIHGAAMTRPPDYENVYLSPRSRDAQQTTATSEFVFSFEAGYLHQTERLKARATLFMTSIANGMNVVSFFHDDYNNFVNYALSEVGKMYMGAELGAEFKITAHVTASLAASFNRATYNTDQFVQVTQDNNAALLEKGVIRSKGLKIGTMPQEAYGAGLNYRSNAWFAGVHANYFRNIWLDFNPVRRTDNATNGVAAGTPLYNSIMDQTKLKDQLTVDAVLGYSWRLTNMGKEKKPLVLTWSLGINNLLNNTNMVIGGSEQLRFDFTGKDVNKFPPRFFYGYGLNYFTSIAVKF
jgi:hypothetical protein